MTARSHHRIHCGCRKQQEQHTTDVVDRLFADVPPGQGAACYCQRRCCRMACCGADGNTDGVLQDKHTSTAQQARQHR